jgi:hypothetical protein
MDISTVDAAPAKAEARAAPASCPRCGELLGAGPVVTAPSFGGRTLRRCGRCGTRIATAGGKTQIVFSCEGCGLPFLSDSILPHTGQRCADCVSGRTPPELPDREVSAAAENEVRAALGSRWSFVTSPSAQPYIERIARQVAERIEGSPGSVRVVLVDAEEHRTLALPSGTILLSTGLVTFLQDEAELAFVLGHEIAHAASGEAAVRLVRLGFEATARDRGESDGVCWSDAAVDLSRLGYGRKRERDADARALEAVLALDYEPASALRYLSRLHEAAQRGDPRVAETLVAHPSPVDRLRKLERTLYGRVLTPGAPRVNREVFRRAAGKPVLAGSLVRIELDPPHQAAWGMTGLIDGKPKVLSARVAVWLALAAAAAAAVATWLLR